MRMLKVCLTFDIDFVDYTHDGAPVDEFSIGFPLILSVFQRHTDCKATWYIRLDAQIERRYGSPDHILQRYESELNELRQGGHEIGWHPHCYVESEGRWKQNIEVCSVVDELTRYAPLARSYGMQSVRMGWGFHTNETMHVMADFGFAVDSSAMPRPRYAWEETTKDWALTPLTPYYPSESDYRVPGEPRLSILEIPISVTRVEAPYDTEHVLRYINLAYHPDLLRGPLQRWISEYSHLVAITHPYELVSGNPPHGLLAFEWQAFEQNLIFIQETASRLMEPVSFLTVSKFASLLGKG